MSTKSNFEKLWEIKCIPPWKPNVSSWWDYEIYATTTSDIQMSVWNGKHYPDIKSNTTHHICPSGTRVRVWTVSRFGDCGVTDNLVSPGGYSARIDADKDLIDLEFRLIKDLDGYINILHTLPTYYDVVSVKLFDGRKFDAWRAIDDDGCNIWTIYNNWCTISQDLIFGWKSYERVNNKLY